MSPRDETKGMNGTSNNTTTTAAATTKTTTTAINDNNNNNSTGNETNNLNIEENKENIENNNNNDNNNIEMGYIFLENGSLVIQQKSGGTNNTETNSNVRIPENEWIDMDIESLLVRKKPNGTNNNLNGSNTTEADIAANNNNCYCSRCHVIITPKKDTTQLLFSIVGTPPTFDGTLRDIRPLIDHCPSKCLKLSKRSDFALLLGMAVTSHHFGHVSIQRICIRIHKAPTTTTNNNNNNENNSINNNNNSKNNLVYKRQKASLLITFATPQLFYNEPTIDGQPRRSLVWTTIKSNGRKNSRVHSVKRMPHSTQLLLSMIRSDWDYYDQLLMADLSIIPNIKTQQQKRSDFSVFPDKLSLEEVYKRIPGASFSLPHFTQRNANHLNDSNNTDVNGERCYITKLPHEILVYRLAPFLRARSLDALRCSNSFLHYTLRSVVPGLKLRLYSHQIDSLCWMRMREAQKLTERNALQSKGPPSLEGDFHRAVTGGATVLLSERNNPQRSIRLNQFSGREADISPNDDDNNFILDRNVCRGGLLCDDPGLGKTITVLSLILQTMGLTSLDGNYQESSSTTTSSSSSSMPSDDEIFEAYWQEQVMPEFREPALNKLLKSFLRHNAEEVQALTFTNHPQGGLTLFKEIGKKISKHQYGESFSVFHDDVLQILRDAKRSAEPNSESYRAAKFLIKDLDRFIDKFKQSQIQSAMKSFSKSASKPNSSVAALIEKRQQAELLESLYPSAGTLLVVPSVLLEHWQEQIRLHVDLSYCTDKIPLFYTYNRNSTDDDLLEISHLCGVEQTHAPLIFIDKTGNLPLPPANFLAMFSIVITSTQRFINEASKGSVEDELKRSRTKTSSHYNGFDINEYNNSAAEPCPLLKVRWLRMVVDEGHSMGKGKNNSSIIFASWISADRRWAMTGTPTRQSLSENGISNILGLMRYLKHDFFSGRRDGDFYWRNLIMSCWREESLACFFRLRSLLSLLMARHTKLDIVELAPPIYQTTLLPMSPEEVKTYNTLVCAVQSNMLITSMKDKISGFKDSLLHKSNLKHAKEAMTNIRIACTGGTRVVPTLSDRFWDEFIEAMKEHDPPEHKLGQVFQYLERAVGEQLTPCGCCGIMLSTLLVLPCGDLICTECLDHKSKCCLVCSQEFDAGEFQLLQPGLDYKWYDNIEEERKKFIKRSKRHVESSVIQPDGSGMLSPIVEHDRPRQRTRKFGDGHECLYSPKLSTGECVLCFREHDSCNLMNETLQCQVCYRRARYCPDFETKAYYLIEKLLALHEDQQRYFPQSHAPNNNDDSTADNMTNGDNDPTTSTTKSIPHAMLVDIPRPVKVIVFSQFRKTLNLVGDRLLKRLGTACIAEYWGQYRRQELQKFIHSNECICMLLSKDGSEGLDLSFVTHIFFLEQLWDKSLESQAVARAWRMGAKGAVFVETILSEHSVEETMRDIDHAFGGGGGSSNSSTFNVLSNGEQQEGEEYGDDNDNDDDDDEELSDMARIDLQDFRKAANSGKRKEFQQAKLHYLLKSVRLVKNEFTSSFGAGMKRKVEETIGDNDDDDDSDGHIDLDFNNTDDDDDDEDDDSSTMAQGPSLIVIPQGDEEVEEYEDEDEPLPQQQQQQPPPPKLKKERKKLRVHFQI